LKAILACELYGGLGANGSMPWPKQQKDLQRFKDLTLNTTVMMGRGTWESKGMPKPLPNRKNIVVTTQENYPLPEGVDAINLNDDIMPDVDWLIGGAALVESLWEQITELHLTRLRAAYECDKWLDLEKLESEFRLVHDQMCLTHNYQIWERK